MFVEIILHVFDSWSALVATRKRKEHIRPTYSHLADELQSYLWLSLDKQALHSKVSHVINDGWQLLKGSDNFGLVDHRILGNTIFGNMGNTMPVHEFMTGGGWTGAIVMLLYVVDVGLGITRENGKLQVGSFSCFESA